MEIYLLRHGIAEEAVAGKKDAERALTDKGVKKLRKMLERAREAGIQPAYIITSPYVRARQTAEVAAQALRYTEPLVESDALVPVSDPKRVWDELRAFKDASSVLLVSHEPLCSALYAYLLNSPALAIEVRKGSIGCVEMARLGAAPKGVLRWLLTPSLL